MKMHVVEKLTSNVIVTLFFILAMSVIAVPDAFAFVDDDFTDHENALDCNSADFEGLTPAIAQCPYGGKDKNDVTDKSETAKADTASGCPCMKRGKGGCPGMQKSDGTGCAKNEGGCPCKGEGQECGKMKARSGDCPYANSAKKEQEKETDENEEAGDEKTESE